MGGGLPLVSWLRWMGKMWRWFKVNLYSQPMSARARSSAALHGKEELVADGAQMDTHTPQTCSANSSKNRFSGAADMLLFEPFSPFGG